MNGIIYNQRFRIIYKCTKQMNGKTYKGNIMMFNYVTM